MSLVKHNRTTVAKPTRNIFENTKKNIKNETRLQKERRGCSLIVYPGLLCVPQGAHVSINARTEDDVDEKLVIGKVAKASGANYSYHKEQKRPMPAAEPVVCFLLLLPPFLHECCHHHRLSVSRITQNDG